MKTVNKIKDKKRHNIKKTYIKPKKVLIVAEEIKFARLLSGNEKKTRDRVLKTLKKWLINCFEKDYDFKEDDFTRVWKGLFYAVWMSDKPLVQEDLCESIAGVLDLFPASKIQHALLMVKAGFKLLATEWYGIDYHRIDKFMMLVRRYLRGSLRCLKRCEWSEEACEQYTEMLSGPDGVLSVKTPLYARNASSMLLHIVDCFLEELAKVSDGTIPSSSMAPLLRPFVRYTALGPPGALVQQTQRLLDTLLAQTELGAEYQQRTKAWEQMGCPHGGPEALERVSDDEDSHDEGSDDEEPQNGGKPLDPRAGRVDVELSRLPVPAAAVAGMLKELLAETSSKAYKRTRLCMQHFEKLSQSQYPLRVTDVRPPPSSPAPRRRGAAKRLQMLEKTLKLSSDELALRGLSRKHRKRLLARSRAGFSIVDDVPPALPAAAHHNSNWEVEPTQPAEKKVKKRKLDSSNKENESKNDKKPKLTNKQADEQIKPNVNVVKKNSKKEIKDSKENKSCEKDININNKIKKKQKNLDDAIGKSLVSKKDNLKVNDKEKIVKEHAKKDKPQKIEIKKTEGVISKDKLVKDKTVQLREKKVENNLVKNVINKQNKKASPALLVNKVKNYQKKTTEKREMQKESYDSPKKVKFVLKNNSMQGTVDYYKSVRQSPKIPFDSSKQPSKTNLKPSTPSPINPFFKKKLKLKMK